MVAHLPLSLLCRWFWVLDRGGDTRLGPLVILLSWPKQNRLVVESLHVPPCSQCGYKRLGHYDANGNLLNRLGEPSVLGLDQSFEPEMLDAKSQGDSWVSPASTLSYDAFSKILSSGLVRVSIERYLVEITGVTDFPLDVSDTIHPEKYQRYGLYPSTSTVTGGPAAEGACPGYGQVPDLDDDVPLPRGQTSGAPARPLPTSRGKGKAFVEDFDSSSFEDDDMSFKLRGLTRGPSDERTGRLMAKVAQTSSGVNVVGSSLPPPLLGPAPVG
uniref:Uncharacterized protein n=1 Tax=Cannabis sativa TaxID=3483 RepID=A0A803PBK4_CANSA